MSFRNEENEEGRTDGVRNAQQSAVVAPAPGGGAAAAASAAVAVLPREVGGGGGRGGNGGGASNETWSGWLKRGGPLWDLQLEVRTPRNCPLSGVAKCPRQPLFYQNHSKKKKKGPAI